jgi:hypothetical protein
MAIVKPDFNEHLVNGGFFSIFLAGTIEMGNSEDWQKKVEKEVDHSTLRIFNPRRDSWDSSWVQEESQENFNHQVNWELSRLEEADIIFMNFERGSKSPISLLELGLFAQSGKLIVCCPKGFWRRGNVEIICTRYNIPFYEDLNSAIGGLKTKIRSKKDITWKKKSSE